MMCGHAALRAVSLGSVCEVSACFSLPGGVDQARILNLSMDLGFEFAAFPADTDLLPDLSPFIRRVCSGSALGRVANSVGVNLLKLAYGRLQPSHHASADSHFAKSLNEIRAPCDINRPSVIQ